jgi:DNA-binding winged helix-turn-helix (wHTH) protein
LAYLVEHANELVTKDMLLETIWPDTAIVDTAITTSMSELRKILGDTTSNHQFIATVPRRGYRFIAPVTRDETHADHATLTAAATLDASDLVGRDTELEQLQQHYARAMAGVRQMVLITGEAGIGKTALVDTFVGQLGHSTRPWIGQGQCINHFGEGEPYLPLLEARWVM